MFGFSVGLIALIVPAIAIITVAAFFIYKKFYDKHTNKVFEEGSKKSRKWIAPWGFTLIVLGAQLILVAGIIYPLSMFMVKNESRVDFSYGPGEGEGFPIVFDSNYDHEYHPDEIGYMLINKGSADGVDCKLYKIENDDGSLDYYISGIITGWNGDHNYELYFEDGAGRNFNMATYMPEYNDSDPYYFYLIVSVEEYNPGYFNIAITNSTYDDPAPTGDPNAYSKTYGLKIISELTLEF